MITIDDLVDYWHESNSELSLQEYLKITDEEYAAFVVGKVKVTLTIEILSED